MLQLRVDRVVFVIRLCRMIVSTWEVINQGLEHFITVWLQAIRAAVQWIPLVIAHL
ncbi:MAG: hypothetical protein JNK44_01715 [Cyclobacteriaceae bacterium]|nr:hypothetical protein [Cyclobacteriaceae bacterium]